MPGIRLVTFLILSLAFHIAIVAAAIVFQSKPVITEAEPLRVAIVSRYRDPGAGKSKAVEAPRKKVEKIEEVEKKEPPKPKKKPVKRVVKEKRKPEKKVISRVEEPTPSEDATNTSQISEAVSDLSDTFIDSGRSGPSDEGEGLDQSGSGGGVEVGYPDYGLNPKPDYPMIARRNGFEGLVLLRVFVLESGKVGKIELEKSSGYDLLDNSALKAVRDWIFIPGKRNGEPVSSWVTVPIKFQLSTG